MNQKSIFRTVESKEFPYLKIWIIYSIFSIMLILVIIMLLTMIDSSLLFSISFKKLLLFITLGLIIFNSLFCEAQKYYLKKSKKQYTRVVINDTGIIFINHYNQTIIAKILWQNIQHRIYEKFDIDLAFTTRGRSFTVYFLWNLTASPDSKIPQWSANKFALMFVKFKNGRELLKALLCGIRTFRPEININPELYRFYKLNPATLEEDAVLLKKENRITFLLIIFSIIVTLIIIFLMFIFL